MNGCNLNNILLIKFLFVFVLQAIYFNGLTQPEQLRFERIATEQGLSNIYKILQDRQGYIWVATNNGLKKYDGYSFQTYKFDPDDSSTISHNIVWTVFEDKDGTIWAGTAELGVCKLNLATGKFVRFRPTQLKGEFTSKLRNVSSICEDSEGMLWIGTFTGELERFDKKKEKFFGLNYKFTNHKTHDQINEIYKDRSGILWVGNTTGLHRLNLNAGKRGFPSNISFTHFRQNSTNPGDNSNNFVESIVEDNFKALWIGTRAGLYQLDRETRVFTRYTHEPGNPKSLANNQINQGSIAEDSMGNLWIGTRNGLSVLNKSRNSFTNFYHNADDPYSLSSNYPYSILVDRSGLIWIGSTTKGINKVNTYQTAFSSFRSIPFNVHSLSNDNVNSILEDRNGTVWIGTFDGLNAFNKKNKKFTSYRHVPSDSRSIAFNHVYAMLEDSDGNLWISGRNGVLSVLDRQHNKFIHYSRDSIQYRELGIDPIIVLFEDSKKLIWLGTTNGLKSFNRNTGLIVHYPYNSLDSTGIAHYMVNAICEDNTGDILVGLGGVALSKLNVKSGKFRHFKHRPSDTTSISANIVSSIYRDSKGNTWIGTLGGGLCYFNHSSETFTSYTEKKGLADNSINSIVEDNEGNLWLGTNNGLSRFSLSTRVFTNYDYLDGLQGNQFSRACFKGSDGLLYFGGNNGFTFFRPKEVANNSYVPPIVMTQFKLFDKVQHGKNEYKTIYLNHNQNFFSFEFAALNYINTPKNQYSYQLFGIDADWVYAGSRRFANYTNIGPGEYTFRVIGSNNNGVWNKEGISVLIIIKPPWWRTKVAGATFVFLLVALIYGIIQLRSHNLLKEKQVLEKEIVSRTVEIVKQKDEIAVQRDNIKQTLDELKHTQSQLIQSEKMASLGELTAGIAHEIQNPLNFVNNFSEVNRELINELKEELKIGNTKEAVLIANDIGENEEKINHHGKRADAIVKNMLQHSKNSHGIKEQTDINSLTDEYLKLAYHGIRAKDGSFNATIKTEYDQSIGKIEIVPQEIGRVILNLLTNAFYAVTEKKKQVGAPFEPTVSVTTKKHRNKIEIRVADNGNGISEKVLEKIFQPFFTTKPTGQGTGLGLSLSYDIVKAHSGELKVKSEEGKGAEFIIQLPV